MKKIAIIGSGFFGSTCALILSNFFKVDLFEKKNKILCGASRANQMRFHLGYHYPRSLKTINEVKMAKKSFINFYGKNMNQDITGKKAVVLVRGKPEEHDNQHLL